MPSCYRKKKKECSISPECQWIVGKGCKPLTAIPQDPLQTALEREIVVSKGALVEHASCKQKLAKATLRIEGFEEYVAILQKKIQTFAVQNKVHKDDIVILQKKVKVYNDKINVHEKDMARLQKENQKYVDNIKRLKDTIADLRAEIRKQVVRYHEGQEEIAQMKKDNYKMIEKNVALEADIKLITSKLKTRVQQVKDLEARCI